MAPQLNQFASTTTQTKSDSQKHHLRYIQLSHPTYTSVDDLTADDIAADGGMHQYFLH